MQPPDRRPLGTCCAGTLMYLTVTATEDLNTWAARVGLSDEAKAALAAPAAGWTTARLTKLALPRIEQQFCVLLTASGLSGALAVEVTDCFYLPQQANANPPVLAGGDALAKEIADLRVTVKNQQQNMDAQQREIEVLKLEREFEAATSSSLARVGDKVIDEIIGANGVNTDATLSNLPTPDQGEVNQLWTSFSEKTLKLPAPSESEVTKFQPILEALWKHCAPAELQVQGNRSAIDDYYRPDITVLPSYECRAEFRTLVTGCEGKTDLNNPKLRKEAFGQLSTYVARTRKRQLDQNRQFIYFALCDLRHIAIVKWDLTKYPLIATRTDFLRLLRTAPKSTPSEGFTALVRLLRAGMGKLGYSDSGLPSISIRDRPLSLTERIAKGGHSYVYAAKYQDEPVAVKVNNSAITLSDEYEVLKKLADKKIPMVPRPILFNNADPTKLVMSFCGLNRLADLAINETKTLTDWLQIGVKLVRVMEKVHTLGIVHRDLRPENITTDGKEFFIVDWGLAGKSGEVLHNVVGVAAYQSSAYLRAMKEPEPRSYVFEAIDDLESIAYTVATAYAGIPRRVAKDILADRAISFNQAAPKQLVEYATAVRARNSCDSLCAILGSPSKEPTCDFPTARGHPCTQLKGKCRFHVKEEKGK